MTGLPRKERSVQRQGLLIAPPLFPCQGSPACWLWTGVHATAMRVDEGEADYAATLRRSMLRLHGAGDGTCHNTVLKSACACAPTATVLACSSRDRRSVACAGGPICCCCALALGGADALPLGRAFFAGWFRKLRFMLRDAPRLRQRGTGDVAVQGVWAFSCSTGYQCSTSTICRMFAHCIQLDFFSDFVRSLERWGCGFPMKQCGPLSSVIYMSW